MLYFRKNWFAALLMLWINIFLVSTFVLQGFFWLKKKKLFNGLIPVPCGTRSLQYTGLEFDFFSQLDNDEREKPLGMSRVMMNYELPLRMHFKGKCIYHRWLKYVSNWIAINSRPPPTNICFNPFRGNTIVTSSILEAFAEKELNVTK